MLRAHTASPSCDKMGISKARSKPRTLMQRWHMTRHGWTAKVKVAIRSEHAYACVHPSGGVCHGSK